MSERTPKLSFKHVQRVKYNIRVNTERNTQTRWGNTQTRSEGDIKHRSQNDHSP